MQVCAHPIVQAALELPEERKTQPSGGMWVEVQVEEMPGPLESTGTHAGSE